MNDLPRQKLCELIATYGRSLSDDPRRCEGLLRDFCGEHKREIHVLVSALKERVATDLLGSSQSGVPREVLLARQTKKLQDNLGLAEETARWAVESWGLALGVIAPESLGSQRTPDDRKERSRGQEAVREHPMRGAADDQRSRQSDSARTRRQDPAQAVEQSPGTIFPHDQLGDSSTRAGQSRGIRAITVGLVILLIVAFVAYSYMNSEDPRKRLRGPGNNQVYQLPEKPTASLPTSEGSPPNEEPEREWIPHSDEQGMRELGDSIVDQLKQDLEQQLEDEQTRNR